MTNNNKLGLYIMLGLIISSIFLGRAYKSVKAHDRYVTVKGLCEKEVKADKVICPIAFKLAGNDIKILYEETDKCNKQIVDFMKRNGIEEKDITISAPSLLNRKTEWNSDNGANDYIITSVVTICSEKVDNVVKLEQNKGELLKMDIPIAEMWEYRTEYLFTKLNEIKPEMVESATKNARETAKKFAKDSKSRLGKIKRASQGQFVITNRDINTPYIKNVRIVSSIDYFLKD